MSSEPGDQETRAAGGGGGGVRQGSPRTPAGPLPVGHLPCNLLVHGASSASGGGGGSRAGPGSEQQQGTLLPSDCEIVIIYSDSSFTGSWGGSAEAIPSPGLQDSRLRRLSYNVETRTPTSTPGVCELWVPHHKWTPGTVTAKEIQNQPSPPPKPRIC